MALRFKAKKATGKDLVKSAEQLFQILKPVSDQKNALDPKLADYVFFPLSHVFRESKEVPVRAVELVLQCLQILISCGWRSKISPDLGKQLLILLSFLAGGSAIEPQIKNVNEEVSAAAFDCLTSLFDGSISLGSGTIGPDEAESIPAFGHAITVVLHGVVDGPSVKVRLAALEALNAIISGTSNEKALKTFFPGIVSSLTKALSPGNRSKNSYIVLQGSLQTLSKILCRVISDDDLPEPLPNTRGVQILVPRKQTEADSWGEATSAQVKLALANVIPLRYHDRTEVQTALFELCISVLHRCRQSLYQSSAMMVETLVILCSNEQAAKDSKRSQRVETLFSTDPALLEILKSVVHDWIIALPRIMQSNNEVRKRRVVDQISMSFKITTAQGMDSDVLNDALALNLRSSVSATIKTSSSQGISAVSNGNFDMTQMLHPAEAKNSTAFSPVLFGESSQKYAMSGLQTLAQQLKTIPMSIKLRQGIVETLRTTSGDEQLASLWLSLQLLDDPPPDIHDIDQFLNIQPNIGDAMDPLLEEVYSFSLDLLATPGYSDPATWKLQALALETIALQARHQARDFRPELVDALYPILERMGSSNAALQQHAVTCLNIIANACEYPSASTLIIDNVDYLVNAVALKLNTFDISPQAPQVLVMMVQLCGPALIPYLDDLVESIFSILACFHGYPRLVEALFSVLHAIVEAGAKAPLPAITPGPENPRRRPPYQPTSISELAARLRASASKTTSPLDPLPSDPDPLPSNPSPDSPTTEQPPQEAEAAPPLSPTYTLLQKIALATPPHLTSPRPRLTLLLLTLLTSTFPALSPDPSTFLPLTATIFPALLARLLAPAEPYITTAAANALAALCEGAGDFLRSRFEDSWADLCGVYWTAERGMRAERKAMGERSRGAKWKVWDAVVGLLVAVVEWVGVGPEMEDVVFEMLGGWGDARAGEVRRCLEGLNADALWLVEERRRVEGGGKRLKAPRVEGVVFREMDC